MDIVYVEGMSEDHLGQLVTTQQQLLHLKLFAVACAIIITLIMIGTWTGNSDLWDKLGDEMGKLNRVIKRCAWNSIGWIPALYYHLQTRNLGVQDTYAGRHRFA